MSYTTLIHVGTLRRLLDEARPSGGKSLVLLDCRFDLGDPVAGLRAHADARIPGALYADLNSDLSAPVTSDSGRHPLPSRSALAGRLAAFGISPETQVVAYDASNGSFAARAWWLLRWMGHSRVAVLDGGFAAWKSTGGPIASGSQAAAAAGVPAGIADSDTALAAAAPVAAARVASADDVLAAIRDPRRLVVDARAPERYAGTVEPIDSVAGHIPGAVNVPFADNLTPDARFLAPEELRRRWLARLGGIAPAQVIAMCGSGVTACHNLLALEIANLPGATLFAGSWSEWIRDATRPVARGGRS